MEASGSIRNLQLQVPYEFIVNGVRICKYRADFVYEERCRKRGQPITWRTVVEDAKGMRTREYIIKKALMRACHGIQIFET